MISLDVFIVKEFKITLLLGLLLFVEPSHEVLNGRKPQIVLERICWVKRKINVKIEWSSFSYFQIEEVIRSYIIFSNHYLDWVLYNIARTMLGRVVRPNIKFTENVADLWVGGKELLLNIEFVNLRVKAVPDFIADHWVFSHPVNGQFALNFEDILFLENRGGDVLHWIDPKRCYLVSCPILL